jgi:hypothetical protein
MDCLGFWRMLFLPAVLAETSTDGDRRCTHQRGLIHPLYHFETQNCFARSRRCYQMQAAFLQVAVKVIQQA